MYTNIESLCCTTKANIMLYANYTSIKKNLYCMRSHDIWHSWLYLHQCQERIQNGDVSSYTCNGTIRSWDWGILSLLMTALSDCWLLSTCVSWFDLDLRAGKHGATLHWGKIPTYYLSLGSLRVLCRFYVSCISSLGRHLSVLGFPSSSSSTP